MNTDNPFITVVMPVRNEVRFIKETINQILSQNYPSDQYEIIVADAMSDDGTREVVLQIASEHIQVKLMNNTKLLSSSGRNIGFRNGKGDIFIVVDGHCFIPDNNFLQNVANAFRDSGADCLGRPQPLDPPDLTMFQKAVALARSSRLGHGSDSLIYSDYEGFASPVSNGAAYSRDIFEKVGYVDESFDACEDVEFNYRVEQAGCRCYTSPKLTIKYYPRETLKALFRQMVRYGRGRRRFTKKHPDALTINQIIPPLFTAGLFIALASLILLAFGLVSITAGIVVPALYVIYFAITTIESLRISMRNRFRFMLYLPFIFPVIHIGLGGGYLRELLKEIFDHKNNTLMPLDS
ncbi:MAG: glycosyltransferase family 2 protein [Dissulfurispiraceae bacterium]|jgi:glycosyltransferase involved in cell wall biosynthesis|nr:glycosyltransferase family 2 protein [Dissulfurispiraceae bacterium]